MQSAPAAGVLTDSTRHGSRIRPRTPPPRRRAVARVHLDVRPDRRSCWRCRSTTAIQDLSDDGNLARLGNNLVDGLSNGAIWALIAIGYTLVYGIIELINFAHGDVFMIGSFVAVGLFGTLGLTLATAVPLLIVGLLLMLADLR